jgi:splicing factor 45
MAAQRPKTGLSLYDNLADPEDATTTISSGPVSYLQNDGSIPEAVASPAAKKPLDPSLRFQPIRRPQAKPANKPKGFIPKAAIKPAAETTPVEAGGAAPASAPPQVAVKTTLADWAATEEDEWRYGTGEKRQRGGRKKKKKKQDDQQMETNWDEIYDPEKPTNVEEYEKSDEKINEVKEWRALLYQHRRRKYDDSDLSDEDDERPAFSSKPQSEYTMSMRLLTCKQINSLRLLHTMSSHRRRRHRPQLWFQTTRPAMTLLRVA